MRHESSAVIDRPIDEVWAFVTDPFNASRMGGGRLAARVTTPGPLGIGSTYQQRVAILGFETWVKTVVTELDPPHVLAHSAKDASIAGSFSARITLGPTAAGTRVVRAVEIEPRGIWKVFLPILGPLLWRQMEAQTRNLKRLLEAGRG